LDRRHHERLAHLVDVKALRAEIISSASAPRYPIDASLPGAEPEVRDAERSLGLRVRAIV
jgi:hypothetical protein